MPDKLATAEPSLPDLPPEDLLDNQVAAMATEEAVFSHTHTDGREFSGTPEEAQKVCPVLGRMSLENARATLQEDDLAARMAARGREKRLAEEAKATQNQKLAAEPAAHKRSEKHEKQERQASSDEPRLAAAIDSKTIALATQEAMAAEVRAAEALKPPKQPTSPVKPKNEVAPKATNRQAAATHIRQSLRAQQAASKPVETPVTKPAAKATVEAPKRAPATRPITKPPEVTTPKAKQPKAEQVVEKLTNKMTKIPLPDSVDYPEPRPAKTAEPAKQEPVVLQADALPAAPLASEIVVLVEIPLAKANPPDEFSFTQAELAAPFEKLADDLVVQLVESLELPPLDEPATAKVYQIVEAIIALPDIDTTTDAVPATKELGALESLIVDLLGEAGLEPTPKVIQSCIKLVKAHKKPAIQGLPNELGTYERLSKKPPSIGSMKRAITDFYQIGGSILRLYLGTSNLI